MNKKNVMIHTINGDHHAEIVGSALKLRGNRVFKWMGDDYPLGSTVSISISNEKCELSFDVKDEKISQERVDVVWFRRRMLPVAPPIIDIRDSKFSTNELGLFDDAKNNFFRESFWVNKESSARLCDLKPVQLREAVSAGLTIPKTLISNNSGDINKFIKGTGVCIYKPLGGSIWNEGGVILKTYTAEVDCSDLPEVAILQSTPGIFQEKIVKAYDVRAQFFGDFYGAIKIESSSLCAGDLDWRIDQDSIRHCDLTELPKAVFYGCRRLMKKLRIVSGAFDFVVDKNGRWFFMEVNEAGQFLFVESWCEELPLLDAFCQFIEAANEDFVYNPSKYKIGYKELIS